MKSNHLLMTLLVVANVVLALVAWVVPSYFSSRPISNLPVFEFGTAQGALVAMWLAMGRGRAWVRVIVVCVIGASLKMLSAMHNPLALIDAYLFSVAIMSLPLFVARRAGLRLTNCYDDETATDADVNEPTHQFSLLTLLGWMTAFAACLSAIVCIDYGTWGKAAEYPLSRLYIISMTYILPEVPLLLASLWAMLGQRVSPPRIVVVLLIWLAIASQPEVSMNPPSFFVRNSDFWFVEGIILLNSLAVCRVAGYRLVWRREEGDERIGKTQR